MAGSSSSSGSSSSTSNTYIPNYPQADFLLQLAQLEQQIGGQQYNWAQNQYADTSALTDQAVNNYLDASKSAMDLAGNNYDRYTQIFQPLENQLVSDANTYASDARKRYEMGAAESDTGQAMNQGRINAEQQLQSFGIDPSAGRYAELEHAQNAMRSAAQAGAGNAARRATEATGRQLRGQAIQVGQQYPGQMVNALNSGVQALSGAVNAKLANLNTGVNAFNQARGWYNDASHLQYPPLGRNSQSSSQQHGNSSNSSGSGSGGGGGMHRIGGGGGGGAGGGMGGGGISPGYYSGGGMGTQPDAAIYNTDGGWGGGGITDPYNSFTWDTGTNAYNTYDASADPWANGTNYNPYGWDGGVAANGTSGGDWYGGASAYDSGAGNTWGDGSSAYDPSYYTGGSADWGGGSGSGVYDTGSWGGDSGGYTGGSADWGGGGGGSSNDYGFSSGDSWSFAGGGAVPFNWQSYGYNFHSYPGTGSDSGGSNGGGSNGGGTDTSGLSDATSSYTGTITTPTMYDQSTADAFANGTYQAPGGLPLTYDQNTADAFANGTYQAPGGLSYNDGGGMSHPANRDATPYLTGDKAFMFAGGGAIPTPGGQVPRSASPTGGAVQDDVPANLTPDEFVIPRDVALWKGQEFFQKLIEQSRKARGAAPAHGEPGPAAPGPATFNSRPGGQ